MSPVTEAERRAHAIAARQCGALSRKQMLDAGLSARAIGRRLATGHFIERRPGTYVIHGVPASWHQELWVARLWAGPSSAISHRAAGCWWEMEGVPGLFIELTTPRAIEGDGVVVHRKRLAEDDVTTEHGLRLTSPARTLLDLGDVISLGRLERALDDALHRRLTTMQELRQVLINAGGRGVRGTQALRLLVESRDPADAVSQTTFERRLGRIIREADLPRPSAQFDVFDEFGFLATPDFAYPKERVAIEADGYRFHGEKAAWERDLRRRTRLTRAGWRVLHFTWQDVKNRPGYVVDEIRRTLQLARRSASAVSSNPRNTSARGGSSGPPVERRGAWQGTGEESLPRSAGRSSGSPRRGPPIKR